MDASLRFVNMSNDVNNSDVVFFQKQVDLDFNDLIIAWKVIKNCGRGCIHPFSFPGRTEVNVIDSWGNYSPPMDIEPGEEYVVEMSPSGTSLRFGTTSQTSQMRVRNELREGSVAVNMLKDDCLLASKRAVAPGQMAIFEFLPYLSVGVVSQVVEGSPLDSAIVSNITTELDLFGVKSADIIMTGGGNTIDAYPYTFVLDRVILH